ncbi:hypothetical protein CDL15_Pgr010768 [Punica granatum]|uniref:Uncharacterized protein n=2 Tax=Punica granatum TaxID=22663 RepID=A0A218W6B5_PUNGR|nr:hypothetical protein CDL15_Pgr010768 [Punica granatum]
MALYLATLHLKPPPPFLSSHSFSGHFSFTFHPEFLKKPHTRTVRALREWQEYEEALKAKDLGRALRFLKSTESSSIQPLDDSSQSPFEDLGLYSGKDVRDWEVLDACLNADDMKLVASAYSFLKEKGFLPNFGRFRNIVLEGPREVTPTVLKSSTGLDVSRFSPKKWGLSGSSAAVLAAFLGGVSFLLSQGIDIRPNLAAVLGLAFLDSVFLGAYLMGCPIRGVILDPIVAMQMGIQGQAGTQFWDEKMDKELAEGRLSGTAFNRYCMVLFAGIAAEALIYGEAEGGENDENLFRSICVLLDPPLSIAQMSNQARWSVLQSYNLLKWHKLAHQAAVKALESGSSLSTVIQQIEESMSSQR